MSRAGSSRRRAAARRWRRRAFGGSGGGGGGSAKSAVGEPGKGAAVLSERAAAGRGARRAARRRAAPAARRPACWRRFHSAASTRCTSMGSDGLLRTLRVSDGAMTAATVPFLPPSARPSSLTFIDGVIYTSTSHGCGAAPNGVWALDLTADNKVTTWRSSGAATSRARPARASAPTARSTSRRPRTPRRHRAPTPTASSRSTGRRLQPKDWFATDDADFNASPVVFKHKDRELVAASGNNGRLYLLDAASLGGADHQTPLHVTAKYSAAGKGGGLATWEERRHALDRRVGRGRTDGRCDVHLEWARAGREHRRVQARRGRRPADARAGVAVAEPGLAAGAAGRQRDGVCGVERRVPAGPATWRAATAALGAARLYVLDAASGKPLWNSGLTITSTRAREDGRRIGPGLPGDRRQSPVRLRHPDGALIDEAALLVSCWRPAPCSRACRLAPPRRIRSPTARAKTSPCASAAHATRRRAARPCGSRAPAGRT